MLLGFWSPKEKDLCLLTLVMSENDIIYLVSLEERELIQSFRSERGLGPSPVAVRFGLLGPLNLDGLPWFYLLPLGPWASYVSGL